MASTDSDTHYFAALQAAYEAGPTQDAAEAAQSTRRTISTIAAEAREGFRDGFCEGYEARKRYYAASYQAGYDAALAEARKKGSGEAAQAAQDEAPCGETPRTRGA